MWKPSILFASAMCLALAGTVASAQELSRGAGRVEISAAPGGGLFVMESSHAIEPKFRNYAITGSLTFNANRWVGIEGDVGFAVGIKQTLVFSIGALGEQKTPHLLSFSGNVVFHPAGSDRAVVPYAVAGIGGLTMFNTTAVENLGIARNETYLMTNVGGGLKWFAARHWGARGDYRLMMVPSKDAAPEFFGRQEMRVAHRVYGALIFTY